MTNKTIDCQCGHSITDHLTVCDDCSCYKFESKSQPTPNPQETVDEHGALRLHLGASIANNRIGRGGIVTEEDADTIIRVFKHWGWSEPHAAKPRPEMELNLAVAKYLYKWAGHFATRGTGYHEHLEDDHKAYEELQSLIAQEADKLANKRLQRIKDEADHISLETYKVVGDVIQLRHVIDTELAELDKGDSHE